MKATKKASTPVRLLPILIGIIAMFFILDRLIGNDSVLNEKKGSDAKEATIEETTGSLNSADALFVSANKDDLSGPYDIDRVVDGDTIYIINDSGEKEKIRFIGADTPESVNPDTDKNTEEGKQASDFTKELLSGEKVWLEYDVEHTDKYGRTLAYVYIAEDEGVVMVEDLLLYNGMARVMTIQPNSKYADHFVQVQADARENERGFWGEYSSLFEE